MNHRESILEALRLHPGLTSDELLKASGGKHTKHRAARDGMLSDGLIHCTRVGNTLRWYLVTKQSEAESLLASRQEKQLESEARRKNRVLLDELSRLKERDALFEGLTGRPLPPMRVYEKTSGLREGCPIILLSDIHAGQVVRKHDTPFGNTYNLAIAEHRLARFFASVEWQVQFLRQAWHINQAMLWIGGDLIDGHIHPENAESGELGPGAAAFWIQERLVSGIKRLLNGPCSFERLDVVCSYGNHGRTSDTMRAATAADHSWEWVIYQSLPIAVNDPRLHVLADRSHHQFNEIYGYRIHSHHGHQIKYGGGVGGVFIPMHKAIAQWDKVYACHYHNIGHYHQYFDTGAVTGNGSLVGYNSYAMSIKATPEVPVQALWMLDAKRGKSVRAPLWVWDAEEEESLNGKDCVS